MTKLSNNNAIQTEEPITAKRPRQLTVLGWFFLLVSIFHFLKFIQAISNIALLRSLPLAVSPFYLAADGLVWGLTGWKTSTFIKNFDNSGFASFGSRFDSIGFFELKGFSTIDIDTPEDFRLAETVIKI